MIEYQHEFLAYLGNHQLNFGTGPAPASEAIRARYALESHLGRRTQWMDQRHGIGVYQWRVGDAAPDRLPRADTVFIDARGSSPAEAPVACVVTADCVPVLIGSGQDPVWAAVHAGRVGLESGVLRQALKAFDQSGQSATALRAWIGPAICADCYTVNDDLGAQWQNFAPDFVGEDPQGQATLDLRGYAAAILSSAGVSQIDVSEVCTNESDEWYSYRRDPHCGRQVGYIYSDI